MIVDQYRNKMLQPKLVSGREEDRMKEREAQDKQSEDVLEGRNKVASMCSANEVSGISTTVLN